jgi:hypothetical protein
MEALPVEAPVPLRQIGSIKELEILPALYFHVNDPNIGESDKARKEIEEDVAGYLKKTKCTATGSSFPAVNWNMLDIKELTFPRNYDGEVLDKPEVVQVSTLRNLVFSKISFDTRTDNPRDWLTIEGASKNQSVAHASIMQAIMAWHGLSNSNIDQLKFRYAVKQRVVQWQRLAKRPFDEALGVAKNRKATQPGHDYSKFAAAEEKNVFKDYFSVWLAKMNVATVTED